MKGAFLPKTIYPRAFFQSSFYLMSGHKEMGSSLLRKAYDQVLQNKYSAMAAKIKVMLDEFS